MPGPQLVVRVGTSNRTVRVRRLGIDVREHERQLARRTSPPAARGSSPSTGRGRVGQPGLRVVPPSAGTPGRPRRAGPGPRRSTGRPRRNSGPPSSTYCPSRGYFLSTCPSIGERIVRCVIGLPALTISSIWSRLDAPQLQAVAGDLLQVRVLRLPGVEQVLHGDDQVRAVERRERVARLAPSGRSG